MIWPFIFLQIATVGAIIMFLRMLLHKQLESGIKRIKTLDQENMRKEVLINEKIEKFQAECRSKLQEAETAALTHVDKAKEDAKKILEDSRAAAKAESKKIIANALEEKESILRDAKRQMWLKAMEFSVDILKAALSEDDRIALNEKITRDTVKTVFGSEDVVSILSDEGAKEVEIVTAKELSAEDRENVVRAVRSASEKISVKFGVDVKIISGMVAKIGEVVIDMGLYNKFQKAASKIKSGLS
jgi:F0F1-type ATP synthase membrane subunit b/b'